MSGRARFDDLTPGVLPGRRQEGITERLCEGTILSVGDVGATFSLPEFPAQKFGPAPWCSRPLFKAGREHSQGTPYDDDAAHDAQPHVGDKCLVGFAGPDRNPWIIGWWGQ